MSTITTTLQEKTYDYLIKESSEKKIPRNKIIEEALILYKKKQISELIKKSYSKLWDDLESIELAEVWLEDFNLVYE